LWPSHACSARVVAGESRLRGQLAAMAPVGEAARGKDIGNVKNKGLPQFCRTFRGEPFAAQGSYKRTFSPRFITLKMFCSSRRQCVFVPNFARQASLFGVSKNIFEARAAPCSKT
jgi:hypothetical protein